MAVQKGTVQRAKASGIGALSNPQGPFASEQRASHRPSFLFVDTLSLSLSLSLSAFSQVWQSWAASCTKAPETHRNPTELPMLGLPKVFAHSAHGLRGHGTRWWAQPTSAGPSSCAPCSMPGAQNAVPRTGSEGHFDHPPPAPRPTPALGSCLEAEPPASLLDMAAEAAKSMETGSADAGAGAERCPSKPSKRAKLCQLVPIDAPSSRHDMALPTLRQLSRGSC